MTTATAPNLSAFARVPWELAEGTQFVTWRYEERGGSLTKVPYNASTGYYASVDDPETWATYADALDALATGKARGGGNYDGIGRVFTATDPYAGIDLDDCLTDGDLQPWAAEIVATLNSYSEISPSGHGVKIWVRGKLPGAGVNRSGFGPDGKSRIELYDTGKYFTVTGNHYPGTPLEVRECQEEFAALYRKVTAPKTPPVATAAAVNAKADARRVNGDKRVERCRAYLLKCPDAISGNRGHDRTHHWFCECLRFGLTDAEALDVIREINTTKTGGEPWSDKELLHKLESAKKKVKGADFGSRLREDRPHNGNYGANGKATTIPAAEAGADFPYTDTGNAERVLHRHGSDLRYCPPWRKWLAWDAARFRPDDAGRVDQLVKATFRAMKREAAELEDAEDPRAVPMFKHAHKCEANKKIRDTIERMTKEAGVCVTPQDLDADPWLLNCTNGTLDLRSFELRPPRQSDLITKLCPVDYDPSATCPVFLAFLDRIFEGNGNLIRFVQRVVGYTLTGVTSERALFILWGTGRNGKSTLLGVLRKMLGDYASQTAADTLMAKRHEGIPNDVARLKGARYVSATETDEGKRLAEGLIKRMTGGEDVLTARFMRAEFFDFVPEFKLFLATNHKPEVRGTDPAIWDRIKLIPFNVRITESEQDTDLPAKLEAELAGVLAWAVEGCRQWRVGGLEVPDEVKAATQDYREEQDRVGDFIAELCERGERFVYGATPLYEAYKLWCQLNGEEAMNQTAFGRRMGGLGFANGRDSDTGRKLWKGLRVRSHETHDPNGSE